MQELQKQLEKRRQALKNAEVYGSSNASEDADLTWTSPVCKERDPTETFRTNWTTYPKVPKWHASSYEDSPNASHRPRAWSEWLPKRHLEREFSTVSTDTGSEITNNWCRTPSIVHTDADDVDSAHINDMSDMARKVSKDAMTDVTDSTGNTDMCDVSQRSTSVCASESDSPAANRRLSDALRASSTGSRPSEDDYSSISKPSWYDLTSPTSTTCPFDSSPFSQPEMSVSLMSEASQLSAPTLDSLIPASDAKARTSGMCGLPDLPVWPSVGRESRRRRGYKKFYEEIDIPDPKVDAYANLNEGTFNQFFLQARACVDAISACAPTHRQASDRRARSSSRPVYFSPRFHGGRRPLPNLMADD